SDPCNRHDHVGPSQEQVDPVEQIRFHAGPFHFRQAEYCAWASFSPDRARERLGSANSDKRTRPSSVARAGRFRSIVVAMKHFSMIRGFHMADFFTLANAACGAIMVFFSAAATASRSTTHFYTAAAMAPAAFVFDVLDGRIARWRHQSSPLGR